MRTVLILPAEFRPFEVDDIKDRPELRISTGDDDPALDDMIQGAIEAYEEFCTTYLAHLPEPHQNEPIMPWRGVGWNGDPGHGRGNHLHLSWNHAPTPNGPPAPSVQVLATSP